MSALATTNGDIYISIVPFSKDVNMGASLQGRVLDRLDRLGANNGSNVCTARDQWGNCTTRVWTPAIHDTWTGCFTDRTQNYDEPANTRRTRTTRRHAVPGRTVLRELHRYCNSSASTTLEQIMPLSYDWTALKNKINTMVPTGNTNQSVGLAWGWMTLLTTDPLQRLRPRTQHVYKRVIILLRRFEHAEPLAYGDWQHASRHEIDARQEHLCDNIKNAACQRQADARSIPCR